MNIETVRKQVDDIENKFQRMKSISVIDPMMLSGDAGGVAPQYSGRENMSEIDASRNAELHSLWSEIERNLPPGFSIDGNLLRHLSFNEIRDWDDISNLDIPRELQKVNEYRKKLILVVFRNDELFNNRNRVRKRTTNFRTNRCRILAAISESEHNS